MLCFQHRTTTCEIPMLVICLNKYTSPLLKSKWIYIVFSEFACLIVNTREIEREGEDRERESAFHGFFCE